MKGNEKANKMAKKALEKKKIEINISISKAEVKSLIWEKVNKMWQDKWDSEEKGRYLYNIQKSVNVKIVYSGQSKDEQILIRLRLGHSALNKTKGLIGKHPTGLCEGCQVEETVEHVLMYCSDYEIERESMKNQLRELGMQVYTLENVLSLRKRKYIKVLFDFLRETGLYDRI